MTIQALGKGVGRTAVWLFLLATLGLLLVMVVVPRIGGATPYTILTGSMRPNMPPGTLVVVKPTPISTLSAGDVITFQIKSGDPTVATHRIIGTYAAPDGSPRFLTKGDANNARDPNPVQAKQIKGKLWYRVPVVGRLNIVVDRAQHHAITMGAAGLLLLYAAYAFVSSAVERRSLNRRLKTEVPS